MSRQNTQRSQEDELDSHSAAPSIGEDEIADWLRRRASDYLLVAAEQIDPDADLGRYGLDSLGAEELLQDAQEWLEIRISSAMIANHRTVNALGPTFA